MLTLQQIIDQANVLMDNSFDSTKKVDWINQINREFFEVVKIPTLYKFTAIAGTNSYTVPSAIRSKNITIVRTTMQNYDSMQYDAPHFGYNAWVFDDATNTLTLTPAPIEAGDAFLTYFPRATVTYTPANLTVSPEAPEEYHSIYAIGLAEKIAKGMDDIGKANNFNQEYQNGLVIAQQNFKRG